MSAAIEHCELRASTWGWASTDDGRDPDVVLAAAGDVPTLEAAAAASWLRQHAPDLRVRFVNVVDLMTLFTADVHPHGMDNDRFVSLFTKDKPVIFAFHGYQRAACRTALQGAVAYAREHFEDPPEISEWVWR